MKSSSEHYNNELTLLNTVDGFSVIGPRKLVVGVTHTLSILVALFMVSVSVLISCRYDNSVG